MTLPLRNMVITIFGGSGFPGRYIVRELAKTGALLRVVSRDPQGALELRTSGYVGQIVLEYGNIHSKDDVARYVQDADIVINLVGILHERGKQRFSSLQAQGAERIAKLAAEHGVKKLLHFSALGVDNAPRSKYARSKLAGEKAVRAAFPGAIIFRPSVVFGPEDDFLNRFAQLSAIAPFMPLIGGGHTRFQPVYVADLAKAVLAALAHDESEGKTYELGGPTTYSFRQLLDYVMTQTGHRKPYLSLPYPLAELFGALVEWLPRPPLTRDQAVLLHHDNIIQSEGTKPEENGLLQLGLTPTALEVVAPSYLFRSREGGRFSPQAA